MDSFVLVALNGLALGLASTLHCAGMCGAISCSLLLAQEQGGVRNAQSAFALTQLGRITAYATAGAAVGLVGAPAIAWLDRDVAFRLLQWAGATSLIWIGLSTAGLLPSITVLDRGFAAISGNIARAGVASPRRELVPFAAGLAWGLMPCAMVYGALFSALLTGSPLGGAATMVAFGVGTLPGLIATSFGFRHLMRATRAAPGRLIAGLAIALFGMMTVLIVRPQFAYLCIPGSVRSGVDRHQAIGGADAVRWEAFARTPAGSGGAP
jgi:sulfite exporter TauE/SafE